MGGQGAARGAGVFGVEEEGCHGGWLLHGGSVISVVLAVMDSHVCRPA